jgi:phosphoesterase RecJ-like protein
MPLTESLLPLQQLCERSQRFLVISHARPDGDAYGSTLGLGLALRGLGKDVVITNPDGFLPGSETLIPTPANAPKADRVIVAVDCADRKRLGVASEQWNRAPDVNIDHHVSNPGYAQLNLIDPVAPATAQVLYEIFETLRWPLTTEIASNLYVGLMTDTGCFRYRQTRWPPGWWRRAQIRPIFPRPVTRVSGPSGCCSCARCSTRFISPTTNGWPGFT